MSTGTFISSILHVFIRTIFSAKISMYISKCSLTQRMLQRREPTCTFRYQVSFCFLGGFLPGSFGYNHSLYLVTSPDAFQSDPKQRLR